MNNQISEIVGFDLGHGETSLAVARLQGRDSDVSVLEINKQKSQPTALAYDELRGILIGKLAIHNIKPTTKIHLGFKKLPDSDPEYRQLMADYMRTIVALITDQINGGDHTFYFVGCPSGWSQQAIRDYESILRGSGINTLRVVPESRAAMIQAIESGYVKEGESKGAVLVVDIGSSTTDCTLVLTGDEVLPYDFGNNLGGSLIDKAILEYSLSSHPDREIIKSIFNQIPSYRLRCEYKCRQAKEEYFRTPGLYDDPDVWVDASSVTIQDRYLFQPKVNQESINAILSSPMLDIDGRQYSWPDAFRLTLERARSAILAENIPLSFVLLTGGASRMGFVEELVTQIFASFPYKRDSEPEFCVSRGLARYGRIYYRSYQIQNEFSAYIDNKLPQLIEKQIPELIRLLAYNLNISMINDVLIPALKAWQTGKLVTLNDVKPEMQKLSLAWSKNPETVNIIRIAVKGWLSSFQKLVDDELNPICQKYNLPVNHIGQSIMSAQADVGDFVPGAEFGDPSGIGRIVGYIMTYVLTIIGGAFLIIGPISLIIYAIAALIAVTKGPDYAEKYAMTWNIPLPVRKIMFSDSKILETCRNKEGELFQQIYSELNKEDMRRDLTSQMNLLISKTIQEEVDRLLILVR